MHGIIFFLLITLSGCSGFGVYRSFENEMNEDSDVFFVPNRDFFVTNGDDPQKDYRERQLLLRTPLKKRYREELQRPAHLKNEREALLSQLSDNEKQHYLRYEGLLKSDSEKIYFLQLSSIGERNRYLEGIGLLSKDISLMQKKYKNGDEEIYIGMSKQNVIDSWGRPSRIDIAGKPQYQNERWVFFGAGRMKYVFFEKGLVKGWILE